MQKNEENLYQKTLLIFNCLFHGKTTNEWQTSTYEWHMDDIRSTYEWHTDDIRVHANDIRMAWHTNDIRVTYGWHKSLSKYLILKEFLTWNDCFGLFNKSKKGSGINFWFKFSAWFHHINASYLILYQLAKFQRHVFFTGYQTRGNSKH